MSLFADLLELREGAAIVNGPTFHPSSSNVSWAVGERAFSGVDVTPANALQNTAVYAAVRVIAESLATPPIKLYKKRSDGGRDIADGEMAYGLVHDRPNEETSSFIWREMGGGHLCTWGNFYNEVTFSPRGEPTGIYQRNPSRVDIDRAGDGGLIYTFTRDDGSQDQLRADRVLHVAGLGFNGIQGFSPVRMARESIGLGVAMERYGASLFGNGNVPGGFIKHPESLEAETQENLRAEIERMHMGPAKAGKLGVLDEGMEWESMGFPNDDAQFLETRTFQVQDVARWYRIPPHLLAELSHATFTNIEHQDLEFVKYTMLPWFRRFESELNAKLLTRRQRENGFFFEFVVDGFLRGDFKTRQEGYKAGREGGWYSVNDIRRLENLNPIDDGDIYLQPMNMAPAGDSQPIAQLPATPDESPARESSDDETEQRTIAEFRAQRSIESRLKLQQIFRDLLEQAAGRVVAAEVNAIRRKIKLLPTEGEAAFTIWLDRFLEEHRSFAQDVVGPVLLSYMAAVSEESLREREADPEGFAGDLETFQRKYVEAYGERHVGFTGNQIKKVLREAGSQDAAVEDVLQRLKEWEETKAAKMALREATQAGGAVAMMAYAWAGVRTLEWFWPGGDCQLCPDLHGRTVQIGTPFVDTGDKVGDPSVVSQITMKSVHKHPPLHKGCRCILKPGK